MKWAKRYLVAEADHAPKSGNVTVKGIFKECRLQPYIYNWKLGQSSSILKARMKTSFNFIVDCGQSTSILNIQNLA
jgi:hypothetical protein